MNPFKNLLILIILGITVLSATNITNAQAKATSELWCMEAINPGNIITLGDNGIIRHTDDGGINWHYEISGTPNTLKKSILMIHDEIIVVGFGGVIIKTTDEGNTWVSKESGTSADLYGVSFGGRNDDIGIAVGLNGLIIRTTDEGETWASNTSDGIPKTNNYRAVYLANESNGIIVGDNGIILVTSNGGISWRISGSNLPRQNYKFVTMLTGNLAYATGENGTIIKTTDGGEEWSALNTGVTSTLSRIRFADDQIAISVGSGGIAIRTTDGGSTWINKSTGTVNDLNCLAVVDESIAYTGGEGGIIMKTTDGGISWVNQGEVSFLDAKKDEEGVFFNYPNPSNPVTTVKYFIPEMSKVSMEVFDVTGKLVNTLVNETKEKGYYSVVFNGAGLSSGTYFCKLITATSAGITAKTMKIILVK